MERKYYVTIGRQLGSGGRLIGENLASRLKIPFYDKDLIRIASEKSKLGKELFEKIDEKATHSFVGELFGLRNSLIDNVSGSNYLCNETLFAIQCDVIREIAAQHSAVFIGRCSDYVLGGMPNHLNVFISAEMEDRVRRVAKMYEMKEQKATDLIKKTDKQRAGYYNYYSGKVWGMAESYDLCINSSVLGIQKTTDLLFHVVCQKFELGGL